MEPPSGGPGSIFLASPDLRPPSSLGPSLRSQCQPLPVAMAFPLFLCPAPDRPSVPSSTFKDPPACIGCIQLIQAISPPRVAVALGILPALPILMPHNIATGLRDEGAHTQNGRIILAATWACCREPLLTQPAKRKQGGADTAPHPKRMSAHSHTWAPGWDR